MNDQKVLIFGSFTEDEIKTLQSQRSTDVGITFGSLDSATLKSVGIFDTKLTGFDHSKKLQPSELAHREKVTEGHSNTGKAIKSVGKSIKEYGSSSFTNPAYERSVLHPAVNTGSAYDSSEKSSLLQCAAVNVSELSDSVQDVHSTNQLINYSLVNGIHKSLKASNGSEVVFRSLLPRGLVNLGNLCFLNATLQALLSCSPFVHLLQELKTRDITEAEYPTLHAFVQFISDFGIDIDPSMKKKETFIPEIGLPFRPLMFESVLKNFTPDVANSLTGRPRQEDVQEFLSFLMHQMHDELLKLEGQIPNGIGRNSSLVSSTDDEEEDDDWETVGPRNRTAVTRTQSFVPSKLSEIFGGQLKSVVKAKGNKASATVQPFLLLHLNIYPEPICSIEDALRMFSAPEALEGYRTSAAGKAEVVRGSLLRNMTELLSKAMAMAVDDDMKNDSVSLLDLNHRDSNESGDVLSAEDVAWADSCLISDLAILDHSMDSLKHVSLDTFPSETIFSAVMSNDSPQDSRIFPTIEETGISGIVDDTIYDFSPTNEQEGDTTGHLINNKDTDTIWSRINSENVFSPTYNEDARLVEASDSEVNSEFPTFVEENLDDYIFKIWELDIPDEEDGLVKQLKKALAGSFVNSTPPASENLEVLADKLLDDVIFGLDDLSLNPTKYVANPNSGQEHAALDAKLDGHMSVHGPGTKDDIYAQR